MEIYRGRFLAIGEVSGLYVYNLHTQQEIFSYNEPNKKFKFWFYRRSATLSIDHDELDLFIPFGKISTLNDSMKLCVTINMFMFSLVSYCNTLAGYGKSNLPVLLP